MKRWKSSSLFPQNFAPPYSLYTFTQTTVEIDKILNYCDITQGRSARRKFLVSLKIYFPFRCYMAIRSQSLLSIIPRTVLAELPCNSCDYSCISSHCIALPSFMVLDDRISVGLFFLLSVSLSLQTLFVSSSCLNTHFWALFCSGFTDSSTLDSLLLLDVPVFYSSPYGQLSLSFCVVSLLPPVLQCQQ